MAHDERTKAQVLALLMLGNTPGYVAKQTGVPYSTVKRWQPAAYKLLREWLGPLDLGQNGHKKNED